MLFLPECFSFLGNNSKESVAAAEALEGPTMARYQQLARYYSSFLPLFPSPCPSQYNPIT
jgi:hypothetical protein